MEAAGDKPGKDIPKDDAAKERMKAEQEMRDAKLAFVECAFDSYIALALAGLGALTRPPLRRRQQALHGRLLALRPSPSALALARSAPS